MNILADIYHKTIAENEKNSRFWEDYIRNLKSINFNVYSEKLRVPVLVPIGSRIFFRGELKHTNEVTVALGADYFAKCSLQQAEVLRQHRIKDAESKLDRLRKEREYLDSQISFNKENIFGRQGHEIIEVQTAEEDRAWREVHRERMRQWKQKGEEKEEQKITDEELWNRLEELELQEELDNELLKEDSISKESFIIEEETVLQRKKISEVTKPTQETIVDESVKELKSTEAVTLKPSGKFELLQKVLDKQNELEEKLSELKNKERTRSKTEEDLIAKLDEMEQLDELEDEMDRLEDIIDTENVESDEESMSTSQIVELKRRVSFADEDDDETLELTFYHSDVEPSTEPYDPKKGITKPSDIYEAYSHLFNGETTSILKKSSKYEIKDIDVALPTPQLEEKKEMCVDEVSRTIVVKDVVEKVGANEIRVENEKKPSLFKQRRQQKKL